jgi:RimJ/RimL family protein N-acetyltransferase
MLQYNVRLATLKDGDRLVDMAIEFFLSSPYASQGVSADRVREMIWDYLHANRKEKVVFVLADADDHPVGCLAALVSMNIFNHDRVAAELIWWIDPSHRSLKNANALRETYEYWAKATGALHTTLTAVDVKHTSLYKRSGYALKEFSYLKVL